MPVQHAGQFAARTAGVTASSGGFGYGAKGVRAVNSGMPPRGHAAKGTIEENTVTALETIGGAGHTAFNFELMLPFGGWLGRNTLGRLPGRVGNAVKYNVGGIFAAPVRALQGISNENLFSKGGLSTLKGTFLNGWADYNLEKTGAVGLEWLEKSAAKYAKGAGMVSKGAGTGLIGKLARRSALGTAVVGGLAIASGGVAARFLSNTKHILDDTVEVIGDLEAKRTSEYDIIRHPEKLTEISQELRSNLITQLGPDAFGAAGEAMMNQSLAMMGGGAAAGAAVKGAGMMGRMMGGAGGGLGMGLMMGGIMLPMAAESIRPNENFLKSYLDIKDMLNAGGQPDVQMYAELVGAASEDARGYGGANSRMAQAVAQAYAAEGAQARDVVIEIAKKEPFMNRLKEAAKTLETMDKKSKKPASSEAKTDAKDVANDDRAPAANTNAKPNMNIAVNDAAREGRVAGNARGRA